jgi:sugar lactone lactonase YvrE
MIKVFSNEKSELGEAPLWHAARESLFWLDILKQTLYEKAFDSIEPDFDNCWQLPEISSALALDGESNNSILMVTNMCFGRLNLDTGGFCSLISLPIDDHMRANDGGVAPNGEFWFGTMEKKPTGNNGDIYSISSAGKLTHQLAKIGIPNTFCWSPAGRRFYLSDSLQQKMYSFDMTDNEVLSHAEKEVSVELTAGASTPDGGAMDIHGNLWNAHWDGFKIQCYAANKKERDTVNLPVPKVTSCCFGGPALTHLFITTAREGMSDIELEEYPLSGNVFVVELHAIGLQIPAFYMDPSISMINR